MCYSIFINYLCVNEISANGCDKITIYQFLLSLNTIKRKLSNPDNNYQQKQHVISLTARAVIIWTAK